MDAFLAALIVFRAQLVALATNLYNNAVDAYNNAVAANGSAQASQTSAFAAATSAAEAQACVSAAAAGANAPRWVAGDYADGMMAWSPSNRKTYRKVGAGASVIDPALDISGAWTVPVASPGTGVNTGTVAAGATLSMTPTGAMVQNLTPLGPGASVKMPAANAMQAAVAAAYLNNQGAHQLGVRDGAGVLKQVIPATSAVQYTLADTSSIAGRWDYLTGGDDGILSFYDKALPAGWGFQTFRPNAPASTGESDKTFLMLTATLAVCLVLNGTSVGLIAFNPATGAMSSVQVITANYSSDRAFNLVKISATTVGVFYVVSGNLSGSSRVSGRLYSFDANLSATAGALAQAPNAGLTYDTLTALVMSGGVVAVAVRSDSNNQSYFTGFAVTGLVLTPGVAPSQFGQSAYCTYNNPPMLTEVGPNCFAVAGIPAGSANAFVVSYSINGATGVVAAVATSTAISLGGGYAGPGHGALIQLPGTSKYITYWLVQAGQYGTGFLHIFTITAAGAISVINGQSVPTNMGYYYAGYGTSRIAWQAFGGATPSVVIPTSNAATGPTQPQYVRLIESTVTPGTVAIPGGTGSLGGAGAELQSPTPGTWYVQVGTTALVRVVYDAGTGNFSQAIMASYSSTYGTINYANVIAGLPVVYGSNNYVATKRGTKSSAINTTATGGISLAAGYGSFEAVNGTMVMFPDTTNKKIRVMEVAQ